MYFDLSQMDGARTYKLLTATVVPRPIAWVVSRNGEGRLNAAPFSFFNVLSGDPPVIGIGIGARAGVPKDTARNILETHDFVVNLVSFGQVEGMNVTAIDFPASVCELEAAGIETVPSRTGRPPRIADSPVALECRLMTPVPLAGGRYVIVADVLGIHVADGAVLDAERCHVDTPRLDLVARMHGGGAYVRTGDVFDRPRLLLEEWKARAEV